MRSPDAAMWDVPAWPHRFFCADRRAARCRKSSPYDEKTGNAHVCYYLQSFSYLYWLVRPSGWWFLPKHITSCCVVSLVRAMPRRKNVRRLCAPGRRPGKTIRRPGATIRRLVTPGRRSGCARTVPTGRNRLLNPVCWHPGGTARVFIPPNPLFFLNFAPWVIPATQ